MTITVEIDDALMKRAEELFQVSDPAELVRLLVADGVKHREAALRLIALGGTMPDLVVPPRGRSTDAGR